MNRYFFLLLFLGLNSGYFSLILNAQTAFINGKITDQAQLPIEGVNIVTNLGVGGSTDQFGRFNLTISADSAIILTASHLGYETLVREISIEPFENLLLNLILVPKSQVLEEVEVQGTALESDFTPSVSVINPEAAKLLPSPFGEFNKVLATLPGVISNNELSAAYSVRGGNFDENLVYVNDIPVYRPFLIRAGQQEGLSFVNPDLIESIEFSSGGWAPKYGDKLSSTLNIRYKRPQAWRGSAKIGLLGGSGHIEGAAANKRLTYLMGVRHKRSQYLLNTLDTEGEYLPKFTDVQSYLTYDIGAIKDRTELALLFSFASNSYLVRPETRETRFGTFERVFRFIVGFDGQELLKYHTYQGGVSLSHKFSDKLQSDLIISGLFTQEREYFEVEGAYRLCDVDSNPGSLGFNECAIVRGIGSNYRSGRNRLDAKIFTLQERLVYTLNHHNQLEFGLGYEGEMIDDQLKEYQFTDSADFVLLSVPPINSTIDLNTYRLTGFLQHVTWLTKQQKLTYGVRLNYWSFNKQLLVSPRLQYAYQTNWQRPVTFTGAFGWYQQPPFYRELRDFSGQVNENIKAQSSIHAIIGADYNFQLWQRNFKFVSEIYYKSLDEVIPYDVDNVRIRYYGDNIATAYAAGLDLRVSGAFIKGTESWFSLGVLKTEENVTGDGLPFIRRPSDQRVTLGIYFEDHMPGDPTLRVYLNLLYGSGLPFGPPNNMQFRNQFEGRAYQRLDIGFSKLVSFQQGDQPAKGLKNLWLSAEILNLLGARNTISYTWITDLRNQQFGVPNNLSQRFFNIKIWSEF